MSGSECIVLGSEVSRGLTRLYPQTYILSYKEAASPLGREKIVKLRQFVWGL